MVFSVFRFSEGLWVLLTCGYREVCVGCFFWFAVLGGGCGECVVCFSWLEVFRRFLAGILV
jgi:hypothetical protein